MKYIQKVPMMLKFIRRNRVDIWHVTTPILISSFMATSSLSGSAVFLIIWAAARGHTHV